MVQCRVKMQPGHLGWAAGREPCTATRGLSGFIANEVALMVKVLPGMACTDPVCFPWDSNKA